MRVILSSQRYRPTTADKGRVMVFNSELPTYVSLDRLNSGVDIVVIQAGKGRVIFSPGMGSKIASRGGYHQTCGQHALACLYYDEGIWFIGGDIE